MVPLPKRDVIRELWQVDIALTIRIVREPTNLDVIDVQSGRTLANGGIEYHQHCVLYLTLTLGIVIPHTYLYPK